MHTSKRHTSSLVSDLQFQKFDQCHYLNKTVGQKVGSTKAMDSYTNINIGHTELKWGGKKKAHSIYKLI